MVCITKLHLLTFVHFNQNRNEENILIQINLEFHKNILGNFKINNDDLSFKEKFNRAKFSL